MFPKGKTRKQLKARRDREEAKVIQRVRAIVEARDGYCIWQGRDDIWECAGKSEWAHLKGHRRWETRGLPPEQRHTVEGTAMMCTAHHYAYDHHELSTEPIMGAPSAGAAVGENVPALDK